jgi:hypothetical protein
VKENISLSEFFSDINSSFSVTQNSPLKLKLLSDKEFVLQNKTDFENLFDEVNPYDDDNLFVAENITERVNVLDFDAVGVGDLDLLGVGVGDRVAVGDLDMDRVGLLDLVGVEPGDLDRVGGGLHLSLREYAKLRQPVVSHFSQ